MDNLEQRLKALRLKRPPAALREDIFGPEHPWRNTFAVQFRRPVQLGWAVAFSLLMVVSGYGVALGVHALGAVPTRERIVEVRVVQAQPMSNDFDFTAPPSEFLAGEVTGSTTVQEAL